MRQSDAESHWYTANTTGYQAWRAAKLAGLTPIVGHTERVEIRNLAWPSDAERIELIGRCAANNSVFYTSNCNPDDADRTRAQLLGFTERLGLKIAETHRSAGTDGIVALQLGAEQSKRGYIPYSKKPMNWHTDGYYNGPDQKIRAMVLHCMRPAADGGWNEFLDPEIAYLRLRDENPDFIDALMHPEAMTIPENREANGKLRPASVGPVFSVDPTTGGLEMRYTARTRSIEWRDDWKTDKARACLTRLLESEEQFIQRTKLQAGEGILCNNSLHNRTGFDPDLTTGSDRLIFRIRFHNKVTGG